jgi:SAM-dependent methyltransferase
MSGFIFKLRCQLGRQKTRALRWLGMKRGDRRAGLADEAQFWTRALANRGRDWNQAEYNERTNPRLELQPELRELIDAAPGSTVRIIDVGSGPLTRVGRIWEGRKIEITAVDPLAEEYQKILTELDIKVPAIPIRAEGERLREQFPEDGFDLAYASNCLDHSYDPIAAIKEMVAVVKRSAHVFLWHFANAGLHERYQGLHQWNFDEDHGDMRISDGRRLFSLKEALADFASVDVRMERAFDAPVVVARIRKIATPPKTYQID